MTIREQGGGSIEVGGFDRADVDRHAAADGMRMGLALIDGAPSAPYSPRIPTPVRARIRVVVGEPHPVGASSAKPMPSR